MAPETRAFLDELGAEIVPFDSRHFGASYPNGNKAEALSPCPRAGRSSSSTPTRS
jgi:hypothetical protein